MVAITLGYQTEITKILGLLKSCQFPNLVWHDQIFYSEFHENIKFFRLKNVTVNFHDKKNAIIFIFQKTTTMTGLLVLLQKRTEFLNECIESVKLRSFFKIVK